MPPEIPDLRDDMHKTYLQLPVKSFMYTPDQIATMLAITERHLSRHLLYYVGRMKRPKTQEDLVAFNIARVNEDPIWRIPEEELLRWLKWKRIRVEAPRKLKGGSATPRSKTVPRAR